MDKICPECGGKSIEEGSRGGHCICNGVGRIMTEIKSEIEWTEKLPKQTGLYIFKPLEYWRKKIVDIHYGDWRSRQNPEELYICDSFLSELQGLWYGPLPEIPEGL